MAITGVIIRRRVDDDNVAVTFYERLTGEQANRFAYGGAELVAVGPFLLFSGADEVGDRLANVSATISVDNIAEQALLQRLGAELIAPPSPTPSDIAESRVIRMAPSLST